MGKGGFCHFSGECGALAGPIAERASEAVHGGVNLRAAQDHFQRHHRKRPVRLASWKNEFGSLPGLHGLKDLNRAVGKRNTVFATALHSRGGHRPDTCGRSTSLHCPPITSPDRAAVRIANSSASGSDARHFAKLPGKFGHIIESHRLVMPARQLLALGKQRIEVPPPLGQGSRQNASPAPWRSLGRVQCDP